VVRVLGCGRGAGGETLSQILMHLRISDEGCAVSTALKTSPLGMIKLSHFVTSQVSAQVQLDKTIHWIYLARRHTCGNPCATDLEKHDKLLLNCEVYHH
jgi:hypothetical protein